MAVLEMVQESKEKVLEFLKKRLELQNLDASVDVSSIFERERFEKTGKISFTQRVNKFLEKFNLHIMHWNARQMLMKIAQEVDQPMIKLASV